MIFSYLLNVLAQWRSKITCSKKRPYNLNFKFHACENVKVNIDCPSGKYISSGTLKYGRWDNSICPSPSVNSTTPANFEIFNIHPVCLQGTSGCDLGNSSFLIEKFGDPFPGVAKHVGLLSTVVNFTLIDLN